MTGLTTHVLDTTHGRPAAGVVLRLIQGGKVLVETVTNSDGRCDAPLLSGDTIKAGAYRLEFEVGAYFRGTGAVLPDPAFLETVGLDFGIADPSAHYHVPLLVSPFGYSTYRGS
jgi:5-hydroxyisourate hydrolase